MLPDAAYHLLNKVDSCNDVRAENKTLIQATQEEINASFDDNECDTNNQTQADNPFDLLLPKGTVSITLMIMN